MAQILNILYRPNDQKPDGRFVRQSLETAELITGHGIKGDHKGGHHPDRQLNIISQEWLLDRDAEGYRTQPGQFGEQIIVKGVPLEGLEPGARLQIGSEATIELTKRRTGCDRLVANQGKSIEGIPGGIGYMAKVVSGGTIRLGDSVAVVQTADAI
jgi:MOSC domain-containing protein YiiM